MKTLSFLIDLQEQDGSRVSYHTFVFSALKLGKQLYLPKMRLQIAVLAILMFWNDPKMWILLK